MNDLTNTESEEKLPNSGKVAKISRGALQVASGAIPFGGGVLSAIAGAWSGEHLIIGGALCSLFLLASVPVIWIPALERGA